MSTLSITSLFSFRRVKVVDSERLELGFGPGTVVELAPDQRFRPICCKCKSQSFAKHSDHQRFLRDLPLGHYQTLIHLKYRKIYCPKCNQIRVEELGVADPGGPRVTRRLAVYIQHLCKFMTIREVAEHLHLDWKTVKAIEKQGLEKRFGRTDYSGLRYLAIDEISKGRYHQYLTVVLDFETGRVVWVGEGRKFETLQRFFSQMPDEVRDQIEAVAMDMWDPYIKAVKKFCPQAAIVFDLFHIVAKYNDVIDQVRRNEVRQAGAKTDKKVIKGSRWILLKNHENLKEKEKLHLEELLKANENLAKVYILKDDLKAIWNVRNRQEMANALDDWCQRALEAGLEPLNRFVETLNRYRYGILNHADHPIHTGRLEGFNNKIKVLKRKAYGFHDLDYFILKIKQACPGIT